MYIGMIYIAHNCPVHDGHDFLKLEWFESVDAIIEWVKRNTKECLFIKDIWDDTTRSKLDFVVKYEYSHHDCIGIHIIKDNSEIAFIKKHPYGDNKEWIVERRNEE